MCEGTYNSKTNFGKKFIKNWPNKTFSKIDLLMCALTAHINQTKKQMVKLGKVYMVSVMALGR